VQVQLGDLGADGAVELPQARAAHVRDGVDPVAAAGMRDEQQRPRWVQLLHADERRPGSLEPCRRHPGQVGHHARPQVRRVAGLGQVVAEPCQRPADRRDGDVVARPARLV
jgi:hypothetical protein